MTWLDLIKIYEERFLKLEMVLVAGSREDIRDTILEFAKAARRNVEYRKKGI